MHALLETLCDAGELYDEDKRADAIAAALKAIPTIRC